VHSIKSYCRSLYANGGKSYIRYYDGEGMQLVPSEFFVKSAFACSEVSDLNAFDKALIKMGIGEQNLVPVSSVIPKDAKEIDFCEIPMGAVTHCVLSDIRGYDEDAIAAGIAYAFRKDGNGGYVAEGRAREHGTLKDSLRRKMNERAESRNVELSEIKYAIAEMYVPSGKYGACVSALVFTRYD
jgi:arginine decarboxylase